MRKRFVSLFLVGLMTASLFTGCSAAMTDEVPSNTSASSNVSEASEPANVPEIEESSDASTDEVSSNVQEIEEVTEVVVLHTNDVHAHIDNFNNEDSEDAENEVSKLSYASVSAYKKELEAQGKNVILLDVGDAVQGTVYGSLDEGESIINIMNAAGYDIATVGNHEFDYGMFRMFELTGKAKFPYISCNFRSIADDKSVFEPYKVFDFDGFKVAFVGAGTPDSITSSSPKYFMDEKGNFIYDFYGDNDGSSFAAKFQEAVDAASLEADIVIGFGHVGDDMASSPYTSTELIPKISGIAAFIDGHSHTYNEGITIKDAEGKDVLISQTGTAFASFGEMTIAKDGTASSRLITDYEGVDEEVRAMEEKCISNVNTKLGEKIADIGTNLYVMNPENSKERFVRRKETNMGDFVADAVYYYFNSVEEEPVDVAFVNGGGIRTDVPVGDMDYFIAKSIEPFGNYGCVVEVTGQQILDAIEFGVNHIGTFNAETGAPAEFGGFLQVAGIKYNIDSSIESSITVDEKGIWTAGPSGDYKVNNLQIYNKESKAYEDIDLTKSYRVGGMSYTLNNHGDGFAMLDGGNAIADYVCEDYMILAEYAKAFEQIDGVPTIKTELSPLSHMDGYLIDYENPEGSGRITIK